MKRILKAIAISIVAITAVSAGLLALTALILGKAGSLPRAAIPVIMTIIGCLAVFAGGFLSSSYYKEKGILFGIIGGLVFTAVLAAVSIFAFQQIPTIASVGKTAAILLSGSIGGILGVNKKSRVKF